MVIGIDGTSAVVGGAARSEERNRIPKNPDAKWRH